jgi:hypothetical protein
MQAFPHFSENSNRTLLSILISEKFYTETLENIALLRLAKHFRLLPT